MINKYRPAEPIELLKGLCIGGDARTESAMFYN